MFLVMPDPYQCGLSEVTSLRYAIVVLGTYRTSLCRPRLQPIIYIDHTTMSSYMDGVFIVDRLYFALCYCV